MPRDPREEERDGKRQRRLGEFIDSLGGVLGAAGLEGGALTGFRVRMRTEEDPSTLLIVRAHTEADKYIAFVGAFTAADALLAWRARALGESIKWREDVPWEQRGG